MKYKVWDKIQWLVISRIHEWDKYYDLECFSEDWESWCIRIKK